MDPTTPLPVLVSLPERAKQRRWTVLIRWILAVPLTVVLLFILVATAVVVFVGWFGALFTGRAPSFTRNLVTIYLRMSLRLSAYTNLLTDRFPPFDTEDVPNYPAYVAVPPPTRLNRWAVFFRYFLFIPAAIVSATTTFGMAALSFIMWFVVLITGWLPAPVHDAYKAILRYQMRCTAYVYLLVPAYPGGLFGDTDVTEPSALPQSQPSSPHWPLPLTRAARRVVVLAIVLGVVLYPLLFVFDVVTLSLNPAQKVRNAYNTLLIQYNQFAAQTQLCQSGNAVATCVEFADGAIAPKLTDFANAVQGTSIFGFNQGDIANAASAARNLASAYTALSHAGPTRVDYLSVSQSTGVNQKVADFRATFATLKTDLTIF